VAKQHFDVVVLGRGLGALASAALLARRSFRVLVLGDGTKEPTYSVLGHELWRRSFGLPVATSPVFNRVLLELSQHLLFRRRLLPLSPMFQGMWPGARLDVPPDLSALCREVHREFPELDAVIQPLYEELAERNAVFDRAFKRDLTVPPASFWERRESRPMMDDLGSDVRAALPGLPLDHPYRALCDLTIAFSTHTADPLPEPVRARLHGLWTRGLHQLRGGEDAMTEFFRERIVAHGGDVRLERRAGALVTKGNRVVTVELDADHHQVSADYVITDLPTRDMLRRAEPFVARAGDLAALPELRTPKGRFVVSLVLARRGVPDAWAHEVFLPGEPALRVTRLEGARGDESTAVLVAEACVPPAEALGPLRRSVVARLALELPELRRHVRLCDSVHDGLPLWDYTQGARRTYERLAFRQAGLTAEPEPMVPMFAHDGDVMWGGEPLRTPLANVFAVGPSVLPAWGQEGELLAAWSVARVITKGDRAREKMRKEMWSKIES
jgi:phytoene dehydrogenase-like protein